VVHRSQLPGNATNPAHLAGDNVARSMITGGSSFAGALIVALAVIAFLAG